MSNALDPRTWPADDLDSLLAATSSLRGEPDSGRFSTACVAGSTGPLATYAGRKALEAGGSAVDAALATAFTQIASAGGCWVSYAGIISMVHYEAATGEIVGLDGGFRTFANETDPASIPRPTTPSGRTALVPGFFAGAKAAHDRFGRLPWADLLLPAIWIADGVPLGASLATMLAMKAAVISRTPEGRAALMPSGVLPAAGERFEQAALARTLRIVAAEGVDHLYRGAWAQEFVDVVGREGGKARLSDLADYTPIWSAPFTGSAHGYDLHGIGLPNTGGAALIEGVKVAAELGVGDPQTDPEALHWLVQIARTSHALTGLPPAQRVTDAHAVRIAKDLQQTGQALLPSAFGPGSHSDFAAAVDADGNMVALCHSINTAAYGNTGIFVQGISVPDAASFQQHVLAGVTPGDPLPNPMNPTIVTKGDEPVLASSSIGAGLLETTLTCVHRHLAHGVSVGDAVRGVLVHGPDYGVPMSDSINNDIDDEGKGEGDKPQDLVTRLAGLVDEAAQKTDNPRDAYAVMMAGHAQSVTGDLSEDFIAAAAEAGTRVTAHAAEEAAFLRGYWVGISRDPATGQLEAGRTGFVNAAVQGY